MCVSHVKSIRSRGCKHSKLDPVLNLMKLFIEVWINFEFIQLYSVLFKDGSDWAYLFNYILYCSGMDRTGYIYSIIFIIVQGWIGLGIFIQLYSVLFRDGLDWAYLFNYILYC